MIFAIFTATNLLSIFISGRDKQDILVGDFIDHYQNLTLKSMLGIQWFNNECDRSDNFMRKVFKSMLMLVTFLWMFVEKLYYQRHKMSLIFSVAYTFYQPSLENLLKHRR